MFVFPRRIEHAFDMQVDRLHANRYVAPSATRTMSEICDPMSDRPSRIAIASSALSHFDHIVTSVADHNRRALS
jgi:hypothetical protein